MYPPSARPSSPHTCTLENHKLLEVSFLQFDFSLYKNLIWSFFLRDRAEISLSICVDFYLKTCVIMYLLIFMTTYLKTEYLLVTCSDVA